MSYRIELSTKFKKSIRNIKKSHRSIENDVDKLVLSLLDNPHQGILIKDKVYKIRIAITSKGRGKSGGARVITYVFDELERLTLLDIFDKSEQENISDNEIQEIIDSLDFDEEE